MVLYGIYNSHTLEALIDTVHRLHNQCTWNEKLFPGKIEDLYQWYLSERGVKPLCNKFNAFPNHHNRKICKKV